MKAARTWIIVAVALVAMGAGAFAWTRNAKPPAPRYETVKLEQGRIVARVTATGTLSALVTVQVGSQVSGRIAQLFADFNSTVKKGQVIAKIDPELFNAALEQARANYAAAKGNLEKSKAQAVDAERQFERAKALAEKQLIATADRDTAESTAAAAQAQVSASLGSVAQANASMHQAEVNLAYSTIKSPIDGVVISRSVDVGQTVAASLQAPTLFTIAEDLGKMQVDTSVAEADVGKLRPEMPATFLVDAYPQERFRGRVRQIRNAPQNVQNVVTYDAVIDVDNPDLKLKPGMTANVTFIYAEKNDVLRIPNAALRFRPPAELTRKAEPAASNANAASDPSAAASAERPPATERTRQGRGGEGRASGEGRGGGMRSGPREEPDQRTLWVLPLLGEPRSVRVRTGISDGTLTELVEGDLHAGDALITEMSGGPDDKPPTTAPPGAPPPGGGLRRVF
ncbi:MAG TPA: efflux RND transporter periplasmic adaptor subunit [Polyangiaceae bacterium]|nr:efflux RND transporter periplasmic adaptor subunit [Polyangiaceae bacterium]